MNKETNTEDKRVALDIPKEGYELTILDQNVRKGITNTYFVTVQKKISSGGSCLVYQGIQNKSVGGQKAQPCDVIIKEFYPSSLRDQIKRINGTRIEITNEEARKIYENRLEGFKSGQAEHIFFAYKNPENALLPPSITGTSIETGAFYSVSPFMPGKVLENMAVEDYSIVEALELCVSICEAIGKVHRGENKKDEQGEIIEKYPCSNGLYLDLKPDNVYVLNNRAYLFDFDTVQKRRSLKFSSYSEGYSAPEQKIVEGIGYKDESKIGYHTDIFSIGAVLCHLLTGKNPYEIGLETIKAGFDWKTGIRLNDTTKALEDDEFIHELDRLMMSMLEEDADKRMNSFICSNEQMSNDVFPVDMLIRDLRFLVRIANYTSSKKGQAILNDSINNAYVSLNDKMDVMSEQLNAVIEGYFKKILTDNKNEVSHTLEENANKASEQSVSIPPQKSLDHKRKIRNILNKYRMILFSDFRDIHWWYPESYQLKFKGRMENGKINGQGTLYYEDGTVWFKGEHKDGKRHGQGTLYDSDGFIIYEGEWKDDKPNGYGTFHYKTGSYYVGEVKVLNRHGLGTMYRKDGSVWYKGEWKNGGFNGLGTYYNEDGSVRYKGELKGKKYHGLGTLYYECGTPFFVGEFKDGRPYQGTGYRKNGAVFIIGKLMSGNGTEYYENGSICYVGGFNVGRRHGQGIYYRENGSVLYEGEWKNNKPDGQGTTYMVDGTVLYKGDHKEGMPNGIGCCYYSDGITVKYDGEWKDGKREGQGTLYRKDGSVWYKGEWKDDEQVE